MRASIFLPLACLGLLSVLPQARAPGAKAAAQPMVTVVPVETDEILANPGIGWETFHRTNKQDKNLPSWIPSTVHYARWGWGELEPQQGKINYDFLDKVLKDSRAAGQTLAFRVMCCSTSPGNPYHPAWLKDLGGRIIKTRRNDGPAVEVPDLDDPKILRAHLDLIARLGRRYDGHPDLDHVDLGSVGWWGEWHMSGATDAKMPTLENQQKVVDAYLAAFKKTPLLMLIGGEILKYATQHGTGWRADCLGDMGGFSKTWCHMRMAYPTLIPQANAGDVWKTAPVAWETCWTIQKWVDEGWSLRFIFNYALALHGSYINNKSAPLPDGENVRPEIERFLKRLGYRLVLRELKHPATLRPGGKLELRMKWQNVGSAPCYRPYRLAYRLANTEGYQKALLSGVTVNRWLPGSIELFTEEFFRQPQDLPPGEIVSVADAVTVPNDMPPGKYVLSVAVVADETAQPVVRLAIKGHQEDGWYPLSSIQVVESAVAPAPYPPSPAIKALTIQPERLSVGDGDNWPITWADDDRQYAAYCDGEGFGGGSGKGSMGLAVIAGLPPDIVAENLASPSAHKTGGGASGRKASGLLTVDGVLYLWARNLNKEGTGSSLAWSEDRGKTWTWATWSFPEIGYPVWLNAGRSYGAAQDAYVYLYSPDTPSAYKTSDQMILARVSRGEIRQMQSYRFFAGLDDGGRPRWSAEFGQRRPVFTDPGHCYRPDVVYNPAVKRYILCTATSGSIRWAGTDAKYLGIFDAPTPWGPWTVVERLDGWGGKENRFQPRIPSKWISRDGKSFYLLYSCFPEGPYKFNLQRCTIDVVEQPTP